MRSPTVRTSKRYLTTRCVYIHHYSRRKILIAGEHAAIPVSEKHFTRVIEFACLMGIYGKNSLSEYIFNK